jgi:hypothetical protein
LRRKIEEGKEKTASGEMEGKFETVLHSSLIFLLFRAFLFE